MDGINKHKTSNLWFGFALGMTASGVIIYLLGTSKGRERLKKLIDFAENTNIEEYIEGLVDKLDDRVEKTNGINSGMDNLIDKIQSFSSHDKKSRRFLAK